MKTRNMATYKKDLPIEKPKFWQTENFKAFAFLAILFGSIIIAGSMR